MGVKYQTSPASRLLSFPVVLFVHKLLIYLAKILFDFRTVQFTLETTIARKTVSEKLRAYLRQVVVRRSREGRIKRTGRGMYEKT